MVKDSKLFIFFKYYLANSMIICKFVAAKKCVDGLYR